MIVPVEWKSRHIMEMVLMGLLVIFVHMRTSLWHLPGAIEIKLSCFIGAYLFKEEAVAHIFVGSYSLHC